MKILRIETDGLELFNEPLIIDFFCTQKVSKDNSEMVTNLFSNIYSNNVLAFVGINASGKTTIMKVISFVIQMMQNKSINNITHKDILDRQSKNKDINIEVVYYNEGNLYKLVTWISMRKDIDGSERYVISNEELWKKTIKSIRSKKQIFEFGDNSQKITRDKKDVYLLDDVSIITRFNKENNVKVRLIDCLTWTDFNSLSIIGEFPLELIKFLDPSIEYLRLSGFTRNKPEIQLKFIGKKAINLSDIDELNRYLSSGTIKGINVYLAAMGVLKNGGYLVVDEIENHFNMEIVSTLIRFFENPNTNKYGASLIFTTHYLEIIDNLERNDSIYVVRNVGGIKADNLSLILDRNDVKKSEWFRSGLLSHTAPTYESYISFKRKLIDYIKKEN